MEKLLIKNIDKIVGTYLPNGRWISEAGDYDNKTHPEVSNYYKFVIYGDKNKNTDCDYEAEQTVVLRRLTGNQYKPNESETIDKYELFTMGLQSATHQYLLKSEIECKDTLIAFIDTVLNQTKQFYERK